VSTVDNLARILALVSTVAAGGSLVVSLLTYRRARPKLLVRRPDLWMEDDDRLTVSTRVVNRSSVTVTLAGAFLDWPPRMLLTLYAPWWNRRKLRRARTTTDIFLLESGIPLRGPVALPAQLAPFSGVHIQDEVPLTEFETVPAYLTHVRLEVELATGEVVRSRVLRRPEETYPPIQAGPRQLTIDDILDT
jgi:hypothetical protein